VNRPTRSTPLLVVLSGLLGALAMSLPAGAQSVTDGPTVVAERTDVQIGERVGVTISGFDSRVVILSICGNEGRRGSVDCDILGSQAREINNDGTPTLGSLIVTAPPVPCPCIILASSDDNTEAAVTPVTVVGHPIAEIVEPSEFVQPLEAEIDAVRVVDGFADRVRASLGGPLRYEVTITVRNTATYVVNDIRATARYTREQYSDDRAIVIDDPESLEGGDIWTQVVEVEVPPLTIGDVQWLAEVSGTGTPVIATDATSHQPTALYVIAVLLVIDAVVLLWRYARRRRRRRKATRQPPDNPFLDGPEPRGDASIEFDQNQRVPETIG
jgi:hypothetical protein